MIDHTCIYVPEDKYDACIALYLAALKPLGYERRAQYGAHCIGFGTKHHSLPDYESTDFWVLGKKDMPSMPSHVAFVANDRAAVDGFHKEAIASGAKDNGAPGLRDYHPNYYAAFVHDAAGNNIEVVCHGKGN